MSIGLRPRILLAFGLAVSTVVALGFNSWYHTRLTDRQIDFTAHSEGELRLMEDLLFAVADLDKAARNYVFTGNESQIAEFEASRERVDSTYAEMRRRMDYDPNERRELNPLGVTLAAKLRFESGVIEARGLRSGELAAYQLIRTGRGWALDNEINERVAALRNHERGELLATGSKLSASADSTHLALSAFAIIVVLALIVSGSSIIRQVTARAEAERKLSGTVTDLETALASVKTLSGLLPICASCKRIRDDQGYWEGVETYVTAHTDARFSHGLCPSCFARDFADVPPPPEMPQA